MRASHQLPGAPTYKGCYDVTRIIWNTVLVELNFPHAKEFLWKLSTTWAHMGKNVCQPCSRWKKFKNTAVWRGAKSRVCPRVPTCLRTVLSLHQNNVQHRQFGSPKAIRLSNLPAMKTLAWPTTGLSVLSITLVLLFTWFCQSESLPADLQLIYSVHATYKLQQRWSCPCAYHEGT